MTGDLDAEGGKDAGDPCGAVVDGANEYSVGNSCWFVTGDLDGEDEVIIGDPCGAFTGGPDGYTVGDPERNATGDFDEGPIATMVGALVANTVGDTVGDTVGLEVPVNGDFVGAKVNAFMFPKDSNALSILP